MFVTDRSLDPPVFVICAGYSHVRGKMVPGDDDLVVEVLVEMTDHPVADDGSKHPVTLHVSALDWKATASQLLKVVRTGKESTRVDVRVLVDDTKVYERE